MLEIAREGFAVACLVALIAMACTHLIRVKARDSRTIASFLLLVALAIGCWLLARHVSTSLSAIFEDMATGLLIVTCGAWLYWKSKQVNRSSIDTRGDLRG